MKTRLLLLFTILSFSFSNAQIVNIPDPIFKAKLISANQFNDIASTSAPSTIYPYNVSSYNTIDTNADGEIQVSEAQAIQYLRLGGYSITDLTGIGAFSNLKVLKCSGNQLTSLNISQNTALIFLNCSTNLLTTLNMTNCTNLLELFCGGNQLTNINLSNCTSLFYFDCQSNQLSNLNVPSCTALKYLLCSYNQLSSLNVTQNTLLSQLEFQNNQLSTINLSQNLLLNRLICNTNNLTSLNLVQHPLLTTLSCRDNQLTSLDLSQNTALGTLHCDNNFLTSLSIKNNSTPNLFGLEFSGNPTLQYICADEGEINDVQTKINSYGYTATCNVNSYCSFTPGGLFYTINGSNRFDGNNNNCDSDDPLYPNLKFNITDGVTSGSFISYTSGNYTIPVQSGTHTLTPQFENPSYFTASPTNATVNFPTDVSPAIRNFCIIPNGIHHDLEVVIIPIIGARPGFDATYKIKYKNKGNLSETATINFNYNDAILDFVSSTLVPTSQNTGQISWNIGTFTPLQTGEFVVTLNLNSQMETPPINAGNILNYSSAINGLSSDETPIDNTFSLNQLVVSSFDPNDKTCLQGNTITPSMVGQYVHYKIRFENTGNFAAQNIVVKDIIDTTKFELNTLQYTDASHSCVTRVTGLNKVEFIFENINLPFAIGSNTGYVSFKIKTKSTLVIGNTFSNSANIYFDYNFPIVTNNYTTTVQALGVNEILANNKISIYPNPVKDVINFDTQENVFKVEVYDIAGRILSSNAVNDNKLNLSDLQTGNYILKVYTESGVSNTKIIKE